MIPNELKNMRPLQGDESLPRDADYMGAIDIDIGSEPVLTIKNIYNGEITLSDGKKTRNVITFVEESVPGISVVRPLILNRGNFKTMKRMFGKMDATTLEGKKIKLCLRGGTRNPRTGDKQNGIRVCEEEYAPPKCEECGKVIIGTPGFTPEQIYSGTKRKYGKGLCAECGKKAKAAAETAEKKPEQDDLAAQLMAAAGE